MPGLYLGELRDSIEVSGYSVDFMFLDGLGFGAQTGAEAFEGSQSLHMGVNDAGDPVHGYACVQFCLKAGSLSDPLVDYLQASFRMKLDQLANWTAFGIADGVGDGIWQQWWWVRADGSVLDEFDRFGGVPVFDTGVWHDVEIHVDPAADSVSLRVDGYEDTDIPLGTWDGSSDGMRCVFVMSGILDDTVQDVYLDRIHVRAGPDGAY